jgi:hypothetical protein
MNRRITVVVAVIAIGHRAHHRHHAALNGARCIESITYGGSAALQGGRSVVQQRPEVVHLIFDQYVERPAPASPPRPARTARSTSTRVPSGVGNAIVSLDYRGYAARSGSPASQRANYFFADNPRGGTDFAGPVSMDYI